MSWVGRLRDLARRHVLAPRQPLGLVSPRLFLPRLTPEQKVHRSLLAAGNPRAPRPISWAVNLWLWFRWVVFYGWRATLRATRIHGPGVRVDHGIGLARQRWSVLLLALAHNIPPIDYYRFQLFRPEERKRVWSYVYDIEGAAFHWSRNRGSDAQSTVDFLSDKQWSGLDWTELGIRTAETLAVLPSGSTWQALPESSDEVFFCKPRFGSGAAGVFRYQRSDGATRVWRLNGEEVEPGDVIQFLEARLATDGYLVQPMYTTHPSLRDLGSDREAITLRLITELDNDEVSLYCAFLEVPLSAKAGSYAPVNVDVTSGKVDYVVLSESSRHPRSEHASALLALDEAIDGRVIPGWDELTCAAERAHRHSPEVFAIAWDFVIDPSGPVLLEGNTTWGLVVPQHIRGPLLATKENL